MSYGSLQSNELSLSFYGFLQESENKNETKQDLLSRKYYTVDNLSFGGNIRFGVLYLDHKKVVVTKTISMYVCTCMTVANLNALTTEPIWTKFTPKVYFKSK